MKSLLLMLILASSSCLVAVDNQQEEDIDISPADRQFLDAVTDAARTSTLSPIQELLPTLNRKEDFTPYYNYV